MRGGRDVHLATCSKQLLGVDGLSFKWYFTTTHQFCEIHHSDAFHSIGCWETQEQGHLLQLGGPLLAPNTIRNVKRALMGLVMDSHSVHQAIDTNILRHFSSLSLPLL